MSVFDLYEDYENDQADFQLHVTMADGSALPTWITYDANTGVISGTSPDSADVPSIFGMPFYSYDFKIQVADGDGWDTNYFSLVMADFDTTLGDAADNYTATPGEIVYGGRGDDVIQMDDAGGAAFGGDGQNTLIGGAGDDALFGNGNYSSLEGGDGNDALVMGQGNGFQIGFFLNYNSGTANGGNGSDTIMGGYYDQNSGSSLYGDDGDDLIVSNHGAGYISGGDGDDVIFLGHAAALFANTPSSALRADSSWNSSSIVGDAGADVFVIGDAIEHDWSNANPSYQFQDFETGVDKLYLLDGTFNFKSGDGAKHLQNLQLGVDIFTVADFNYDNWDHPDSFSAGNGATFLFEQDDYKLWYDADGDAGAGGSILIATFHSGYTFDAADFAGISDVTALL